jgi:hypothetical protein
MASKLLVCFGGPLDGQEISVASNMKKVKDGRGGIYHRHRFFCGASWKEALVYERLNFCRVNLQILCRSSNG